MQVVNNCFQAPPAMSGKYCALLSFGEPMAVEGRGRGGKGNETPPTPCEHRGRVTPPRKIGWRGGGAD
jgi:hypothetical protein